MENNNRRLYFDIMKILACFFVIFNHTGNYGFFLFSTYKTGSFKFFLLMFLSIFCKFAVPLFLTISGALLLNKQEESLKHIWLKRILKIVILLTIFSFIYYLYEIHLGNQAFNLPTFIKGFYEGKWNSQFWYLYIFIAYLASLPLLRTFVKNLDTKYFYYMFILVIIARSIMPIVQYLVFNNTTIVNDNMIIKWITEDIFIYPCLGYFLEYKFDINKHKKIIPIMWCINIITIILSCYLTSLKVIDTGICTEKGSQDFFNIFSLINCSTIFITIKYFCLNINIKNTIKNIITSLSECTLGIYVFQYLIALEIKIHILDKYYSTPNFGTTIIYTLTIFTICYIITLILKKIPIIKKIF